MNFLLDQRATTVNDIDFEEFFTKNSLQLFIKNNIAYVDLDKIDEFKDFINIEQIADGRYKLPNDFLIKYSDRININLYMRKKHDIDNIIIETYKDKILWNRVSTYQCKISESNILKNIDKIKDQAELFLYEKISIQCIINNFHKFDHIQLLLMCRSKHDGKYLFNKIYKHLDLDYIKNSGYAMMLSDIYDKSTKD